MSLVTTAKKQTSPLTLPAVELDASCCVRRQLFAHCLAQQQTDVCLLKIAEWRERAQCQRTSVGAEVADAKAAVAHERDTKAGPEAAQPRLFDRIDRVAAPRRRHARLGDVHA